MLTQTQSFDEIPMRTRERDANQSFGGSLEMAYSLVVRPCAVDWVNGLLIHCSDTVHGEEGS